MWLGRFGLSLRPTMAIRSAASMRRIWASSDSSLDPGNVQASLDMIDFS
jgi:hypothetical protein